MAPPDVPEYKVEADDGLGLRRFAAVEDGGLRLCPDEAAAVGQETVEAGAHLTFGQHYTVWTRGRRSRRVKKDATRFNICS